MRWLERAHRLAPGDPTIGLLLASEVMANDPDRALRLLCDLLTAWPSFRDAAAAAAAAELRLRRPEAAAVRVGELLARGAAPAGAAFRSLAAAICRATSLPGWISLDSSGRVEIVADGEVELTLDGRQISARIGGPTLLPPHWRKAARLEATRNGRTLLGSPADCTTRRQCEGFVDLASNGALAGWAWLPSDPDRPALLTVAVDGVLHRVRADGPAAPATADTLLDRRRSFCVPAAAIGGAALVRVTGPDGRDLAGSPLTPGAETHAARLAAACMAGALGGPPVIAGFDAWRALDVALLTAAPRTMPMPTRMASTRGLDIVIPVFRGAPDLSACLATLDPLPRHSRIVVVDDASPDPALQALVARLATAGTIRLLRQAINSGFPAAANTGLREALRDGRDVLLLNPDTLLPPGAVARLARAARAAPDIGSVTPMTNDGTLTSYPPAADLGGPSDVARLDTMARQANGTAVIDIPTAVGFCMFIRHDCLAATGLFREDVFAQGYGEENDWSLRARHLGWRHVAAGGVFVAHRGGRSFGAVKADLIARNTVRLNRLHPGYDAAIAAFLARDPLAPFRRAIDFARWTAGRQRRAVVLVSHGGGGGIDHFLAARAARLHAEGTRPVLLTPTSDGGALLSDGTMDDYPDLHFRAIEAEALAELLDGERVSHLELHHFIGHHLDPAALARRLGVPLDVTVHDNALWCPRVTLVDATERYCGEPADIAVCNACVRDLGGKLREKITVDALRARSRGWLEAAREVAVACDDGARRIARQFPGIRPMVAQWEDDRTRHPAATGATRLDETTARVVLVGAIGLEKGYAVLLGCARDAARRDLPLDFAVVGHTVDDARLLETGRVFVTGRFAEGEAAGLVAGLGGRLGFIPSVIPETWCYALSALWEAGLEVACFALGAQAERVARSGTGAVLPLGLPSARVNDLLLSILADQAAPQARRPARRLDGSDARSRR